MNIDYCDIVPRLPAIQSGSTRYHIWNCHILYLFVPDMISGIQDVSSGSSRYIIWVNQIVYLEFQIKYLDVPDCWKVYVGKNVVMNFVNFFTGRGSQTLMTEIEILCLPLIIA